MIHYDISISIIIVSSYGLQRFYNEFNKNKKLKYSSIMNLFLLILFHNKFIINLLTIDVFLKI